MLENIFTRARQEHEHTGTSEREITCPVDLQESYEKAQEQAFKLMKTDTFEAFRVFFRNVWKLPSETLCDACSELCGYASLLIFFSADSRPYLLDLLSLYVSSFTPPRRLLPLTFSPSLPPSLQWTVTGLKSHLCFSHISAHG